MKPFSLALLIVSALAFPALAQNTPTGSGSSSSGSVPSGSGYSIGGNLFVANPITPTPDNTPTSNSALGVGALGNIAPIHSTQYDTALGYQTLGSLTTADHETAVGAWALTSITDTTGNHNTGLGIDSLRFMTAGVGNVGVGESSCTISTSQNNDTCVGFQAGYNGGSGEQYEVFVGAAAGLSLLATPLTGQNNTGVGGLSLKNVITTAHDITALGYQSGLACTTCASDTFVGDSVGSTNPVTGTGNILIGYSNTTETATASTQNAIGIGSSNHPGTFDVFVGDSAGAHISADFDEDVGVGQGALTSATSGAQNVALGYTAGNSITSGGHNLILGAAVGPTNLTTGSRNIALGTSNNCDFSGNISDTLIVCESSGSGYLILANLTAAAPKLAIGGPLLSGGPYSAAGTAIPACSATYTGYHATVSDASSPTYGGTYASGGAVYKIVLCNGTNWLT